MTKLQYEVLVDEIEAALLTAGFRWLKTRTQYSSNSYRTKLSTFGASDDISSWQRANAAMVKIASQFNKLDIIGRKDFDVTFGVTDTE